MNPPEASIHEFVWVKDGAWQGRETSHARIPKANRRRAGGPWMRLAARAEITAWERAEGRDGAKQKRRCYQRRSGALRVEPAHFDWRWRERPALALLAWEALARDPLARLRRIQVESTGTTIKF
jgi:hypothetical protein